MKPIDFRFALYGIGVNPREAHAGKGCDHGAPPQQAEGVSAIGRHMTADRRTVNLSNGSLNFSVPLGQIGGRSFWLPYLELQKQGLVGAHVDRVVTDPTPHTEPVSFAVCDDAAQAEDSFYKIGPG